MADKPNPSDNLPEPPASVSTAVAKPGVDTQKPNGIQLAIREFGRLIQAGQNFWRKSPGLQPVEEASLQDYPEKLPVAESGGVDEGAIYQALGVGKLSTFQEIHVQFLRLIRDLLQSNFTDGAANRASRQKLQNLCIAHDVLHDPVTRTDYDFRALGLRPQSPVQLPEDTGNGGNRPALRIGELLQCAEILEPAELDIAVDMHKATPEMMFGQFLVKSGFLSLEELDSALLGQRLILAGKLTVAQFKMGMKAVHEKQIPLAVSLQGNGWLEAAELEPFLREPEVLPDSVQATVFVEPEVVEQPHVAQVEQGLSIQNAVPGWANQLVWDDEPLTLPESFTDKTDSEPS